MTHPTISRLKKLAQEARDGFPPISWRRAASGEEILLKGSGQFQGLKFSPGETIILEAGFEVPASSAGIPLAGEPLECTINSLFPSDLEADGCIVFHEDLRVPVAAGPALVDVCPALQPGRPLRLRHRIHLPANQISPWHFVRFTTPALRARSEAFDLLAAQLELCAALADGEGDQALCGQAFRLIDMAFEAGDVLSAAPRALELLQPFSARIAALTVHLVGHSHIDLNWLWTWDDTREVILRDIRSVLGLMEEFPELTFSHSQSATYAVIEEEEPALFASIRDHIRAGRWEPICMTWVEQDSNIAGGESHTRQLLHGMRYAREKLGCSPCVYHAPDTFGHPGNLPALAAASGARFYYHHRCNPGGDWPAYWWEGQDGSRVLALWTPSYNGGITAGELVGAALRGRSHGLRSGLHFHGIGDHGGGPSRQSLQALRRYQAAPLVPRLVCSTLAAYGDAILAEGANLPAHRGESRTIFEGCYTTHGDTKAFNRQAENLLLTAETLAARHGIDAAARLAPAWQKVLFNQFHDIAAGSAIHEVYAGHAADFHTVRAITEEVTREALETASSGFAPGQILLANPLPEARREWVVVPSEIPLPNISSAQPVEGGIGFVAEVEGYGVAACQSAFHAGRVAVASAYAPFDSREDNMLGNAATEAPYYRIETQHFLIYLRRDCGVLVSFFDKVAQRELVAFGLRRQSDYLDTARPDLALGVLQVLQERPHGMSSWQMHEVESERSLISGAESRLVEEGPLRVVIETSHSFGHSKILQRAIFYADLAWVDFETRLVWNEPGNEAVGVPNLKVSFCARLEECEAWFETALGASRRPADGQEAPLQRWAAVGGSRYGFAILTDSKYGCDVLGSRLRLSLVRSAYDPDAIADLGEHEIRYRFVPHAGSWREAGIPRLAAAFNQPLLVHRAGSPRAITRPPFQPACSGSDHVRISSLKQAEDGPGWILRFHESIGHPGSVTIRLPQPDWTVFETDPTEQKLTPIPISEGTAGPLDFTPWQVRTLRFQP